MKKAFYFIASVGLLLSIFTILNAQKHQSLPFTFFHSTLIYWFVFPYVILLFAKSLLKFKESFTFYFYLSIAFTSGTALTHFAVLAHLGASSNWGVYALPAYIILALQYLAISILAIKNNIG